MAIPNSPNWSSITLPESYLKVGFEKPIGVKDIHDISLGPKELNESEGKLTSRYWLVTQENGQVIIRKN